LRAGSFVREPAGKIVSLREAVMTLEDWLLSLGIIGCTALSGVLILMLAIE
jgi:hypothetical protein